MERISKSCQNQYPYKSDAVPFIETWKEFQNLVKTNTLINQTQYHVKKDMLDELFKDRPAWNKEYEDLTHTNNIIEKGGETHFHLQNILQSLFISHLRPIFTLYHTDQDKSDAAKEILVKLFDLKANEMMAWEPPGDDIGYKYVTEMGVLTS